MLPGGKRVSKRTRKSIREEDELRNADPISEYREDARSGNPNARYH